MRQIALALLVVLAACGGTETSTPTTVAGQAEACEAIRQTIAVAAEAYEVVEGEPPADLDVMLGDYLETDTPTDWFTADGGDVLPVSNGPCD